MNHWTNMEQRQPMTVVQPIMQVHEDLAALFSRNLHLDPRPEPVAAAAAAPAAEEPRKIVYSISQHYHHSGHIARQAQDEQPTPPQQQQQQRPASEPPQPEYQATEAILISHGVDASALSAAQLELFKTADEPQKLRLIELWRIVPPTNSNDNPALAWSSTTVEQEETLARMRWERKQQEEQGMTMSLDGTPIPTPMQDDNGRWLLAQSYMEPYMMSGYEQLAAREYQAAAEPRRVSMYNPATDPVYGAAHNGTDWATQERRQEQQRHQQQQQLQAMDMEHQYGMLMAMRENEML